MRISDWSSDKCSSDLVAGPPVRPSGTLAELQNGVDHLLSALDAGAEILVDRLGGGNEGILVGLVHRDAARLQLVQQVGLHLGGRLVRSEEHTSELQSLMRISYAVFCLKKKKQKELSKATKKKKT